MVVRAGVETAVDQILYWNALERGLSVVKVMDTGFC